MTLHETDWIGLTFAGIGEYAYFRQPTLTTGQRVYAWPTVAWSGRARRGRSPRAPACTARSTTSTRCGPTCRLAARLRDPDLVASTRASCSSATGTSSGRTSCRRSSRARSTSTCRTANQSNAPVFDTAVDDFNFGQLFSVNRYLGNDRIGDANQLTLALTSRLLDPDTGAERLRVAVGQRFYFQDQRVVLNESPRSASTSDVLRRRRGPALRRLGDRRAVAVQLRRDADRAPQRRRPLHAGAGPGRSTRATRYSRQFVDPVGRQSRLNQFDLSGQWPVNAELDAARALELLAPRQQDAGGRGRRRVQCRLLGPAARRPAADDDDADDDEFGLPADRVERTGAVRH